MVVVVVLVLVLVLVVLVVLVALVVVACLLKNWERGMVSSLNIVRHLGR